MAEVKLNRLETGESRIRNVPIAVTPEGFWCCPAPVVFQKTLKTHSPPTKPKPTSSPSSKSSVHRKQTPSNEKISSQNPPSPVISNDQKGSNLENPSSNGPAAAERTPRNKGKVSIEFGEPGTSNLKVVLRGKHGFSVKLNVHKDVLEQNSSFFAGKLREVSGVGSLEIADCEDVEGYVETVGLMYCKDMKLRLIKQSVQRVLRVLKVSEAIGFNSCIQSCLDYLEAAPWVGEEEEEKVISYVLQLQSKNNEAPVSPILKRVASNARTPPKDALSHILNLVLKSTEERGRREMKSLVLNLLKENNATSSMDGCESLPDIYKSCKTSMTSLLSLFIEASEEQEPEVTKNIALEADNLTWLFEILADRRAAEEFADMWAHQSQLAGLHVKLPAVARHHVSKVTARLFVGIGKGELLPCKDTRQRLLETWLEPLMGDYNWLQHGCRSFERKVVEEGIGRTILTLPMEEQQSILLSWMGNFLKSGDGCPNLQRAFEVWWRRAFIRPHSEGQGSRRRLSDHLMTADEAVD